MNKGSKVLVTRIKASQILADKIKFDDYNNAKGVLTSVWDYPYDDPKVVVRLLPPNHGLLVLRISDIEVENAS